MRARCPLANPDFRRPATLGSLLAMPASETQDLRRLRVLSVLYWGGIGLAPLTILILMFGTGTGALRIAVIFAVMSVVAIAISITMRRDTDLVKYQLQHMVIDHTEQVRAEIRHDLMTASRNTYHALSDKLAALAETVEVLRRELEEALESAPAGGLPPTAPGQGQAPPGGPPGVVRTETVHVTRRTTTVDTSADGGRGTVYGSRAALAAEQPDEADRSSDEASWSARKLADSRDRSRSAGRGRDDDRGRGDDEPRGRTRERTDRHRDDDRRDDDRRDDDRDRRDYGRRDEDRRGDDRRGDDRRGDDRRGRGSRSSRDRDDEHARRERRDHHDRDDRDDRDDRYDRDHRSDDRDDDRWEGVSSGDRWAALRDDDHGRELRIGERRSSVRSDDRGREVRVEDRWASIRREEPRDDRILEGEEADWEATFRSLRRSPPALPSSPGESARDYIDGDWDRDRERTRHRDSDRGSDRPPRPRSPHPSESDDWR